MNFAENQIEIFWGNWRHANIYQYLYASRNSQQDSYSEFVFVIDDYRLSREFQSISTFKDFGYHGTNFPLINIDE